MPTVAKTPNERRRNEKARTAILRAARELLDRRGFRQLTIEGIAARAGVGKQTIYRWWPSKAAVVLEAYLAGEDAVSHPEATGSTREDVRALLGWLVDVLAEPTGGAVVAGLVA